MTDRPTGKVHCQSCEKETATEILIYTPGMDAHDEYRTTFDIRVSIHCKICGGFISEGNVGVSVMREDGTIVGSTTGKIRKDVPDDNKERS